jgi:DNA gyrase/topoisomerase IV subunit B
MKQPQNTPPLPNDEQSTVGQYPHKRELIIVEGESAANSVLRCIDSNTQAVLAMQGKPMNSLHATRGQVASNAFLFSIVQTIGAGWDDAIDLEQSRFDRVSILTDPDPDGVHCGLLLLWFFYRWMRVWLNDGRLVQIVPPRFEIHEVGKNLTHYAYTEKGALQIEEQIRIKRPTSQNQTARIRGLAALPRDIVAALCVNIATRKQVTLTAEDAIKGW